MRTRPIGDLPDSSFKRTFQTDYFRITDEMWQIQCQLQDPIYNMILALDISVKDMIIHDAKLNLLNYPHPECRKLVEKVKCLIGAEIRDELKMVLRQNFGGPQGCENIFNMVNAACRVFAFLYPPWAVTKGQMTLDEAEILKGGSNCVAFPCG